MIPVSETDMQPFNNQPILQVKFEEDMGPICGDCIKKKGGRLETWCFLLERGSWERRAGYSDKLMGERE